MSQSTSLVAQIKEDMKTAMRSKDMPRLSTIRLILAAVKQYEVDKRIEIDDANLVILLEKMLKQRRDSIVQFEKAGRDELAKQEQFESDIIQTYLPEPLSEEEVVALIEQALKDTGAESMKDMGKVIGLLKPQLQGRADMAKVSALVKQKLGD